MRVSVWETSYSSTKSPRTSTHSSSRTSSRRSSRRATVPTVKRKQLCSNLLLQRCEKISHLRSPLTFLEQKSGNSQEDDITIRDLRILGNVAKPEPSSDFSSGF